MRQQLAGETEGRAVALKVIPHASLLRSKAKQKVRSPSLTLHPIAEKRDSDSQIPAGGLGARLGASRLI